MSLRSKLLFVLLAVSLAPLVVMHFFGTRALERLGADIAGHSRTESARFRGKAPQTNDITTVVLKIQGASAD
ncbi:MAG: hypothetical protein ACOCWR_09745 [Oceanidesulfovibrio sp.]